jgi:hypothetical protein
MRASFDQCVDPLRRQQRAIRDQRRDHADLRCMRDHRREFPVHKRLTAGEVQKPNAIALQDVAGELCIWEGNGVPRHRRQPVAGKAAEAAARVASAGNGEVAGPRTAVPNGPKRQLPD